MKTLLISVIIIALAQHSKSLKNSTWTYKIGNTCIDTLKLKENNMLTEYDCEMRYTFSGSYEINKDTLITTEKDDSHSEDHGKVTWYKTKYLIKKDVLKRITTEKLSNNKWTKVKLEPGEFNYQLVR